MHAGRFFHQMRATLAQQRGAAFAQLYAGEQAPGFLKARDVLCYATSAGAVANGLGSKVGSISKGKQADIVLLKPDINVIPVNDAVGAVVLGMDVSNVDTVLVAGKVLKQHGRLVGVDLPGITRRAYETRDSWFARTGFSCKCPRHLGVTVQ